MSFLGVFIGFTGYLMIGNINLAVIELSLKKRIIANFQLIICAAFLESVYVIFTFFSFEYLSSNPNYNLILQLIGIILTIAVGIWNLFTKNSASNEPNQSIITRAYFSMLFHPQQIPYWLIWYEILKNIGFDSSQTDQFNQFVIFNAIGTILILILYAKYGNKILTFFKTKTDTLAKIIGIFYIIMGIFQIFTLKFQ